MTHTPEPQMALVCDRLELYRRMWVLRLLDMALEESRIDGLLDGPAHAPFGHEAVAVGISAALRQGDVVVVATTTTTIPCLRHAQRVELALPLGPAIVEMLDPSRGADDPLLPGWAQSISYPTVLGKTTMFALGDAYSQRWAGDGAVTVCVIEGRDVESADFDAPAHVAASWRLPVVFVVEKVSGAAGPREHSHGMPVVPVDGNDAQAVRDTVSQALQRAGAGEGPILVAAVTDRRDDVGGADPLVLARQKLLDAGVGAGHLYEVERLARHLVAEAELFARVMLRVAEPAPVPEPEPWSAVN